MGAESNLAPVVIIKRKKVINSGGHHGGAWKVAYADFVTAMMAFFMLMWLLNATTEDQKQGLADYFSPTVTVNRVSGGGSGSFGGDSVFSEDSLAKNGTGASAQFATESAQARGASGLSEAGAADRENEAALKALEDMLTGHGGESTVMDNLRRHVVTRITDEGLVVELFAQDARPLFKSQTNETTELMDALVKLVAEIAVTVTNGVAVEGHVATGAIVLRDNPVWDLSTARANQVRLMLEAQSIEADRLMRVTGHADREPAILDRMAPRNDRIEIILLRAGANDYR